MPGSVTYSAYSNPPCTPQLSTNVRTNMTAAEIQNFAVMAFLPLFGDGPYCWSTTLSENRFSTFRDHALNQRRHRLLHKSPERREKLGAERAVDHAMVARERHRHHAGEADRAVGLLDRLPARRADREDRRVRRIDDRRKLAHAVHAEVRDRRRAALVFVRLELARAGALGELTHLGGDRGQRLLLRLPDHRRDQPAVD